MHDEGGTQSSAKVFANIFISFVGAGVLGLPFAFKEVGTLLGVLLCSSFVQYFSCFSGWGYGGIRPRTGT